MASCDAQDVQVKAFSPPFRRAREARAGSTDPSFCQAEKSGLERCPPGYCRCSGELKKQVETPDHPWGAPESTPKSCTPPKLTKQELEAAVAAAKVQRKALKGGVLPALEQLVQAARAKPGALAEDEAERVRELEEWLALLKAE